MQYSCSLRRDKSIQQLFEGLGHCVGLLPSADSGESESEKDPPKKRLASTKGGTF